MDVSTADSCRQLQGNAAEGGLAEIIQQPLGHPSCFPGGVAGRCGIQPKGGVRGFTAQGNAIPLLEQRNRHPGRRLRFHIQQQLQERYGIPLSGETADPALWLDAAAARHTSGETARMAQRLLDDFRKSALGSIALELPG